ncbi:hypothetical protein [Phyllobacterium chamaecytisi]|uniref:hypothetical protein n=1 Tax=Phyllobacterium chamaecytisi TaxID=2876082 RepID=UPI001CCA6591|nr:hypothetical protein [Phyllobacterium sp. KW56]MBZ9603316.1 hypothetical protein [Phyllobacterium sp. KW56]
MKKTVSLLWCLIASSILLAIPRVAWSDEISLKVYATDTTADDSLWINSAFDAKPIVDKLGTSPISVSLSPDDIQKQPTQIFLKWHDSEEATSIPVFSVAAFGGQEIDLFLSRPMITSENVSSLVATHCNGMRQSLLPTAFRTLYICRASALFLAKNDKPMSGIYKRAVNGWFTANYFLYTRSTNKVSFSPYGLQDDLVDILRDVIQHIDVQHVSAAQFSPLRAEDIRQALEEKDSEGVRMVGLVPKLIQNGKIGDAKAVNDHAIQTLNKLNSGNSAVQGVTPGILMRNDALIRSFGF